LIPLLPLRRLVMQGVPAKGQPGHAAADFFRGEYGVNYAIFTAKKPQVRARVVGLFFGFGLMT
jgi:hypothetical protein